MAYWDYLVIASTGKEMLINPPPSANYIAWSGALYLFSANTSYWIGRFAASVAGTVRDVTIYVSTNTRTGAGTFRSWHNGGNGNILIDIPVGITGQLTDLIHADTISDGDSFNWVASPGAGTGDLKFSFISCSFNVQDDSLPAMGFSGLTIGGGSTYYGAIVGGAYWWMPATETDVKITSRHSATYSNLAVLVRTNGVSNNSYLRFRKNGANGNQVVLVPIGGTGRYEDTTHTDSFVSGDEVNLSWTPGSGGTTIGITAISARVDSDVNWLISASSFVDISPAYALDFGTTYYQAFSGACHKNAVSLTETPVRVPVREAAWGNALTVRIPDNTLDGSTTIRTRIDGANGYLNVSIPSGSTGEFSDITSVDTYAIDSELCWMAAVGGTSGAITVEVVALETVKESPFKPVGGNPASDLVAAGII